MAPRWLYYKLYDAESTARPVLKKNADYLPLNNPSIGRIDISNVRFTNDMDKLARIIAVHEDLLETYESGGADLFPDDNSEIPLVGGLPPSLGSLQSDPVVIVFKENIQQERDKKKSVLAGEKGSSKEDITAPPPYDDVDLSGTWSRTYFAGTGKARRQIMISLVFTKITEKGNMYTCRQIMTDPKPPSTSQPDVPWYFQDCVVTGRNLSYLIVREKLKTWRASGSFSADGSSFTVHLHFADGSPSAGREETYYRQ